jgi:hypothetical protein
VKQEALALLRSLNLDPRNLVLPERIRVGTNWWKIESHEGPILWKGKRRRGLCYYEERRIIVNVLQTKRMVLSSLLHELYHAIEVEKGIVLPHWKVHELETVWADILLKNVPLTDLVTALRPSRRRKRPA